MTLFDPGPPVIPDKAPGASYTARLTARRRALLDAGVHPTSGRPLLDPADGATCGGCAHHVLNDYHAHGYHKCARAAGGLTNGPASDVRVGWPACVLYDPGVTFVELVPGDVLRGWHGVDAAEVVEIERRATLVTVRTLVAYPGGGRRVPRVFTAKHGDRVIVQQPRPDPGASGPLHS